MQPVQGEMMPGGGIRVSAQGASRTGIDARQLEQLYEKMSLARRQMVFELLQFKMGEERPPPVFSTKPSSPITWYTRALDTRRYVPFQWCSIHFQCFPAQNNTEALFKLCMSVLEHLALPMAVLVSRYECLRESGGQVISVAAPIACLQEFVRVHRREGDAGDHFHHLRVMWREAGISEDLFRQVALVLFRLRQHGSVPFVVLHSSVDKQCLWVCFRDAEAIENDSWLQGILHISESQNERCDFTQPLQNSHFLAWAITEHSAEIDRPQALCQNRSCFKGDDRMVPEEVARPFLHHEGPREKRQAAYVKRMMGHIWHEKYEPLLAEERDRILAEEGKEDDRDRAQEIQRNLLDKYEEMASTHESELAAQWRMDNCMTKMRRCSGCKQVYYCSSECQKADWSLHKRLCPLLQPLSS